MEDLKAGIGWMLMDHIGRKMMKGSTSIEPFTNPLEAKVYALREAVLQMKGYIYKIVTFYGDSKVLYDVLNHYKNGEQEEKVQAIATYYEDVMNLAVPANGFRFKTIR